MRSPTVWLIVSFVALVAGLPGVVLLQASGEAEERYQAEQPHMGTLFRIVVYSPDEARARAACQGAFARIAQLDHIMSDYRDDSELTQLCRQAGGNPVKVSPDLFRVLSVAQEIARATDGAFDVTAGPVIRLWRRARRQRELPDPQRLQAARALVGYDKMRLDPDQQTVELKVAEMRLDLGGIGKGFAADEALHVLRKHGCTRAMIVAGGDVRVGDPPPNSRGWKIAIAGLENGAKATEHLLLAHAAVSTSGDLEQYFELNGTRYSHIVDPKTGQALLGRRSATVVAPTATQSDAWATALCVLGEKGIPLIEKHAHFAARLILADDESPAAPPHVPQVRILTTSSWQRLPRP
ncbi:MAG: FAD:protein FMN transferase [Gemmatales bacterium]|nr:FAD:protein FMN transferase [Gemmatales bacterium]MDW7994828.1 FAD:protein FMN transferase [Gemmatales bacterium]